ncbi:MAG: hypothetical protein CVV61_03870 [Tenericutes bacterium HGW-Tenericutes-6]|nr:MAG: hypothetical protein CVV61_03870 [Tenericutes bacterium HGW-Tenericutes-6]
MKRFTISKKEKQLFMWIVKEKGFDKDKITHHGNQFLIGHLKLGVRGTLDGYTKEEKVAIHLPMVYDQVDNLWREPINAFNPLYTEVMVNGVILSPLISQVIDHEISLDLRYGLLDIKTTYLLDEIKVILHAQRFVDYTKERAIVGLFRISCNQDAKIDIKTGIDYDVWDLNGPHLNHIERKRSPYLSVLGMTEEKKRRIVVKKDVTFFQDHLSKVIEENKKLLIHTSFHAKKDQTYGFEQFSVIGVDDDENELNHKLNIMKHEGYKKIFTKHQKIWDKMWQYANVEIKGDQSADLSLRYAIYHLLILSPNRFMGESIPARGISGQTYKGAIFWDTEIFMLPFYLNTDQKSAKSIILYRIKGLEGAKRKAQSYGFQGAFYAWESQEDGYDACTDYNVTDVITGRHVRTYFKDKQVHISGDVVYAIDAYIERIKDFDILKQGALEVILEVARFYLDYGVYVPLRDRFEVWDVLGPDEYHERVHNNAFTNQLFKFVFGIVLKYEAFFKEMDAQFFHQLIAKLAYDKPLKLIHLYHQKIYIKKENHAGIIEQFDNYFKLKDIKLNDLLNQRIHQNEYLGGHGLAGDTKIIKQADVITMLYLFKDLYHVETMEKNFLYYEPKTEHGSSLSASMYALIGCMIGQPDYAYPLFMKSATVDLTGNSKQYAGGIYIGGTHPAASGGAYMTAIYGFAGLHIGKELSVKPKLPKTIEQISFHINHLGKLFKVVVNKNDYSIKEVTHD